VSKILPTLKLKMFNLKLKIQIVSVTVLISGCAWNAPPQVEQIARNFLKGNCLDLFLDPGSYKYQHLATNVVVKQSGGIGAVFALSDGPAGQYCGYATSNYKDIKESSLEVTAPLQKLEAVAIARCEATKTQNNKNPCKIFAINNDIVWKRTEVMKLE